MKGEGDDGDDRKCCHRFYYYYFGKRLENAVLLYVTSRLSAAFAARLIVSMAVVVQYTDD